MAQCADWTKHLTTLFTTLFTALSFPLSSCMFFYCITRCIAFYATFFPIVYICVTYTFITDQVTPYCLTYTPGNGQQLTPFNGLNLNGTHYTLSKATTTPLFWLCKLKVITTNFLGDHALIFFQLI